MTPTPEITAAAEMLTDAVYLCVKKKLDEHDIDFTIVSRPQDMVDVLAEYLQAERDRALEDAAKHSEDEEFDCCGLCAEAIRSLKSKPAGDGG